MGAELGRLRAGKKTRTGMSEDQLGDFASKELVKSIDAYLVKVEVPNDSLEGDITRNIAQTMKRRERDIPLCPFPGCEKGYVDTRLHNLSVHGGKKPIGAGSEPITRAEFDALAKPTIAERHEAEKGLLKPDNALNKSIKSINVYLDKQSRSKCGHKKGDPNHLEAA